MEAGPCHNNRMLPLIWIFALQLPPPAAETPPLKETVVVTARRGEEAVGDSASFATVLAREDLAQTPALTVDEQLARVPGFGLFRRSSSLTSHPTTQGVSLRGVAPSGAGRTLVLFDGVPLNDPFGGWVYWNRVPAVALERLEVVRGAGSQLYGSGSLAGTVQLVSRSSGGEARLLGGDPGLYDLQALAAGSRGTLDYLASGRVFGTRGVPVISGEQRGAVDRPAGVDFESFFGRIGRGNAHLGFNFYHEQRGNGTALQANESRLALVETGWAKGDRRLGFHVQSARLESTFSRILPDRSREFLTARQDFRSVGLGASAQWDVTTQSTVGADWRYASWDGNRQNLAGIFLQHAVPLTRRLEWILGVRGDLWQNRGTRGSLNPRTALAWRALPRLTLRGSAYRGFRAPTLNELYRPFRVGNIVTLANPDLRQERLWGAEGGADLYASRRMVVRLNAFWNRLVNPVENATISVSPGEILRQRRNGESIQVRGVEAEWILQGLRWGLEAAYLFSDASTRLTRRRTPQVARHQGVASLEWRGPVRVRADGRWVGRQFEDDLGLLPLGGYFLLDVGVRRPLGENLELFVAAQNLLDRQYAVGRTPLERLGEPRLLQGGIRLRWLR